MLSGIMTIKTLMFAAVVLPSALHAQNLLINGDFELDKKGWKGDGKILVEDGKKIWAVECKNSVIEIFDQAFKLKDPDGLKVTFRYKASKDYEGKGFELWLQTEGSLSWFTQFKLQNDGEWHEATWNFTEEIRNKKPIISFKVQPGKGTVYFDDVSAELD